jgi:hypothetical protein
MARRTTDGPRGAGYDRVRRDEREASGFSTTTDDRELAARLDPRAFLAVTTATS